MLNSFAVRRGRGEWGVVNERVLFVSPLLSTGLTHLGLRVITVSTLGIRISQELCAWRKMCVWVVSGLACPPIQGCDLPTVLTSVLLLSLGSYTFRYG